MDFFEYRIDLLAKLHASYVFLRIYLERYMIRDIGRFHLLIVVAYQWPGPPTKERVDLASPMEQTAGPQAISEGSTMLLMRTTWFREPCCTCGIPLRSGSSNPWTQEVSPVLALTRWQKQNDRLRANPTLRRIRIEIFPHLEEAAPP